MICETLKHFSRQRQLWNHLVSCFHKELWSWKIWADMSTKKLCLSFLRLLVCSFFIGSLFLCLFVFHTCILLTYSLKVFFAKKKIPFWFASSSPFYRIRPTYNSWMQNVVQKTPLSTKKLWNVLAVKDKHQISLSNIKCFQFFQS